MKKAIIISMVHLLFGLNLFAQTSSNNKTMIQSEQQVSMTINVSPDQAWDVIKTGKDLDKWLPEIIQSCELKGDIRVCGTANGTVVERILKIDHESKEFKFIFVEQNMLPSAEQLTALIRIFSDADGKAIVNYRWTFDVADKEAETQIKNTLVMMGNMGIKSLENYILN